MCLNTFVNQTLLNSACTEVCEGNIACGSSPGYYSVYLYIKYEPTQSSDGKDCVKTFKRNLIKDNSFHLQLFCYSIRWNFKRYLILENAKRFMLFNNQVKPSFLTLQKIILV